MTWGGVQWNHRGPSKWNWQVQELKAMLHEESGTRLCYREAAAGQECGQPVRTAQGKERAFPYAQPPERNAALPTP